MAAAIGLILYIVTQTVSDPHADRCHHMFSARMVSHYKSKVKYVDRTTGVYVFLTLLFDKIRSFQSVNTQ